MKNTPYNSFVIRRGQFCGSKSPSAKLNEDIVREILLAKQAGDSAIVIADRMNLNRNTVSQVYHRRTWRHVSLDDRSH